MHEVSVKINKVDKPVLTSDTRVIYKAALASVGTDITQWVSVEPELSEKSDIYKPD
jgi:ABC-type uncharacterized transport system substrate-binding protein